MGLAGPAERRRVRDDEQTNSAALAGGPRFGSQAT
jgi:hypothetical protein